MRPGGNRALRGQKRPFELGTASSGGRIIDETSTESESGKAVPCATHFVNGVQRYCRQPQRLVFDYQPLRGRDIGA